VTPPEPPLHTSMRESNTNSNIDTSNINKNGVDNNNGIDTQIINNNGRINTRSIGNINAKRAKFEEDMKKEPILQTIINVFDGELLT
jgi:hypothetical protein